MKKPKINYAAFQNKKMIQSQPTTVNNFKRLFAYIIDWYAASMLAGIPVVLIYSIFFQDLEITQNITELPYYLFGLFYFCTFKNLSWSNFC